MPTGSSALNLDASGGLSASSPRAYNSLPPSASPFLIRVCSSPLKVSPLDSGGKETAAGSFSSSVTSKVYRTRNMFVPSSSATLAVPAFASENSGSTASQVTVYPSTVSAMMVYTMFFPSAFVSGSSSKFQSHASEPILSIVFDSTSSPSASRVRVIFSGRSPFASPASFHSMIPRALIISRVIGA